MRVSLGWLRELCPTDLSAAELGHRLTMAGLEVEAIVPLGEQFAGVVVAEVRGVRPHPRSPRLTIVTAWDGSGLHEVVCGAPNVPGAGGKILWARPGSRLPDGREIGQKEIQGQGSAGMICSEAELGIGEEAGGIVVLADEDAKSPAGTLAQDALGLRDTALEINVTPNRGDCLSHLGIAREVAALAGTPLRRPVVSLDPFISGGDVARLVHVSVEASQLCTRYSARYIHGLRIGPSPRWMRRRLEAVGMRSISNLVDVTNYVMLEVGQPLHAFDYDRLADGTIIVRRASEGEAITTLDGAERQLRSGDLLICDPRGPVALAGVMGGAGSEVQAGTSRVLLESACFDPISVRKTARRLGLHSESSHRFERGVDPNGVDFASMRASRLLCELAGGSVARGVVDVYPKPVVPVSVELRPGRASRLLGFECTPQEVARVLQAIELTVDEAPGSGRLRVTCPTFRRDLEREVDLIEEIVRLVGYERIPTTLPGTREAPRATGDILVERVQDALWGAGWTETISFGFTSPTRIADLRLPKGHPASSPLMLRNPLREEQSVMRTSLVPGLLAALARNLAVGVEDVRLFEVGNVFYPSGEALPREPRSLAGVVCGYRSGWLKPGQRVDFFDIKGVLERLSATLRVPVEFSPLRSEDGFLHPGVAASVLCNGSMLGVVGEVHPETRERFGIEPACFAFEVDLELVPPLQKPQFAPLPRFPSIVRDVSFLVGEVVSAQRVRQVILESRSPLLESFRVLEDYREPGKVPAGKKGMLWSMTYRASDRTLTDSEVDEVHEGMVSRLLSALGAERR
ncbi:MAG: phenylalanine--tRNA ligase subunit beta [Deltaproteobacteria bacterium]|nr:phenylalanine--tRNA ligase subunit beta [Deltaproteobacteria bacterium]